MPSEAELFDRESRERFWASIGRRPPPGPPLPRDDWFNQILLDAAAIKRGVVGVNKAQLQQEVARHREKLERAEARLEALEEIPEWDPFENGTVLRVIRRGCTFACLRAAGHWYTTGRTLGLNRATWGQFADWLVDGGVTGVDVMVAVDGSPTRLADLPQLEPSADQPEAKSPGTLVLTVRSCGYATQEDHAPHAWGLDHDSRPWLWCPGQ